MKDVERRDILRAGISYALAEDKLGLERFREKFSPVMAQGPDRQAFDIVTSPVPTSKPEFLDIVRSIAAVDTLGQFVRDMRAVFGQRDISTAGDRRSSTGASDAARPFADGFAGYR